MNKRTRIFPKGCTIQHITKGKGYHNVNAVLYGPDGRMLISATLEYITEQILAAEIED
jgi:hypothetical protein